jgi:hypothetical protein
MRSWIEYILFLSPCFVGSYSLQAFFNHFEGRVYVVTVPNQFSQRFAPLASASALASAEHNLVNSAFSEKVMAKTMS